MVEVGELAKAEESTGDTEEGKIERVWDEWYLGLGGDKVPQMKVVNCLRRIGKNPITYYNSFPIKKWTFLSEIKVKYVQDIIFARDTENLGMLREEVIRDTLDI